MNAAFAFFAALATRHSWKVVGAWLLVLVVAAPFALRLESALTKFGWDVEGSESKEARTMIERKLPQTFPQNLIVVFHSDETDINNSRFAQVVNSTLARIEGEDVVIGFTSFFTTGNPSLVSEDGHTTYAVVGLNVSASEAPEAAPSLMGQLRQDTPAGFQIDVTGAPAMWADFNDVNRKAMFKGEAMAFPVVMLVLILVFGSLIATALPLGLTMMGLACTFAIMYGLGQIMPVAIWGENFAMMIGMGVGVDYALFVVTRYRQEVQQGKTVPEAITVAMETAGKAIFFSGLIVVVALLPVLLVPVVALRSMGLGMIIAVAVVLAASFTLLPALLALLGERVNQWRLPLPKRSHRAAGGPTEAGFWHRWAMAVMTTRVAPQGRRRDSSAINCSMGRVANGVTAASSSRICTSCCGLRPGIRRMG